MWYYVWSGNFYAKNVRFNGRTWTLSANLYPIAVLFGFFSTRNKSKYVDSNISTVVEYSCWFSFNLISSSELNVQTFFLHQKKTFFFSNSAPLHAIEELKISFIRWIWRRAVCNDQYWKSNVNMSSERIVIGIRCISCGITWIQKWIGCPNRNKFVRFTLMPSVNCWAKHAI